MIFTELRYLTTIYHFPENEPKLRIDAGGSPNCNFDVAEEKCAWYTLPIGRHFPADNGRIAEVFRRAHFEALPLDLDKFECTNDRAFPFGDDLFMFYWTNFKRNF